MKSLCMYQVSTGQVIPEITEDALERFRYQDCGKHDVKSFGFSENIDGVLVSEVSGNIVMNITVQEKKINKHQLEALVKEEEQKIFELFSKPMSKHQKAEFIDQKTHELLPDIFPTAPKTTTLFINKKSGLLVVEGSAKFADDVTEMLRNANGSLPVIPVQVSSDCIGTMTSLVEEGCGDLLSLGEKATLMTEDGLLLRASKNNMTDTTVTDRIPEGAIVLELGLVIDDKIKFTLKEDFTVAGISYSKEVTGDAAKGDEAGTLILKLDAVNKLVDTLIEEFGGIDQDTL